MADEVGRIDLRDPHPRNPQEANFSTSPQGGGKGLAMANEKARRLRAEQTDAERKLWSKLRELKADGFHFRRQAPIGKYIADFVCHSCNLVIEIDGGQHNEKEGLKRDAERTAWLEGQGYKVLRFWNDEALTNIEGVMQVIRNDLRLD
ncbi:MAG TPA: endonuclease domain-containing protein [Parvibaculum sp.]